MKYKVPDAGASHKSEEVGVLDAFEEPCNDEQESADKVSIVSIDPDPLDENVMNMEAIGKEEEFSDEDDEESVVCPLLVPDVKDPGLEFSEKTLVVGFRLTCWS